MAEEDAVAFRHINDKQQVELRGKLAGGSATDIVAFQLPEGFRPPTEQHFEVESSAGKVIVTIAPDGSVLGDPGTEWISLDGIVFDVASAV